MNQKNLFGQTEKWFEICFIIYFIFKITVNQFFSGYLFSCFCLHGYMYFCGNLFSLSAILDSSSTIYSLSSWTWAVYFCEVFIFAIVKINCTQKQIGLQYIRKRSSSCSNELLSNNTLFGVLL